MKYFLLILVFFISSCRPPEPGTDEWFKEKHKELLKADPEVNLSLEEFKDIFSSYLTEEVSDESLMEKHSIGFWLMEEDLLLSSENAKSMAPVYIRILKQCAANFSIMYANMEAGLQYGEAITGLNDVNEMSRLSDVYKDNAYYFATRASEIHFKLTEEAAEEDISDEISLGNINWNRQDINDSSTPVIKKEFIYKLFFQTKAYKGFVNLKRRSLKVNFSKWIEQKHRSKVSLDMEIYNLVMKGKLSDKDLQIMAMITDANRSKSEEE